MCVAEVWHNRDEKQNFLQRFDAQLVREEKRLEVEEELRVQVGAELSSRGKPGACDEGSPVNTSKSIRSGALSFIILSWTLVGI